VTARSDARRAAAVQLGPGEARTVRIEARSRWTATGVLLEAGGRYVLRASGTWHDRQIPSGPEGYLSPSRLFRLVEHWRRYRSASWMALIGGVGRRRSGRFVIGDAVELLADRDGELSCFANDLPLFRLNNRGCVELVVARVS
jgi:hypothetical protein